MRREKIRTKRKLEDVGEGGERLEGSAQVVGASGIAGIKREREEEETMGSSQVKILVDEWVNEINKIGIEDVQDVFEMKCSDDDETNEEILKARDDVHGGDPPLEEVKKARKDKLEWNREAFGVSSRFRIAGIKRGSRQCR